MKLIHFEWHRLWNSQIAIFHKKILKKNFESFTTLFPKRFNLTYFIWHFLEIFRYLKLFGTFGAENVKFHLIRKIQFNSIRPIISEKYVHFLRPVWPHFSLHCIFINKYFRRNQKLRKTTSSVRFSGTFRQLTDLTIIATVFAFLSYWEPFS